jgi:lysylphosphatidylglycerol synthetase-like protein (DUF2156 family)
MKGEFEKMPATGTAAAASRTGFTGPLYAAAVAVLALTGFGQLPIYQRYYLSDLPAMGWLADFYVTRNVHYAAAALFLGLIAFAALDYRLARRRRERLTRTGLVRGALIAGIVASGALIVVKNFPAVHFPDRFVIALNLSHLGAVMGLLAVSLYCRLKGRRWTEPA